MTNPNRTFKSLNPLGLPDSFDAEIHGEDPIVKVEESKNRITVSYTFPGFFIYDDARDVKGETVEFIQINIAKSGFVAESGKSLLPSFGRYVQIPFNCDYKVTVEKGDSVQFDDILVLPAQEKLLDSSDEEVFEYDEDFYSKDELYPSEVVEVTGPFDIDDYSALLLHVRPLQYNPVKKKLIGFSNITVTIDVSSKTDEPGQYNLVDPELNREAYGNFFVNPRRRIGERLGTIPGTITIPPIVRGSEFLIIYHNTFENAAKKLAKWKNMRGLRTETVSIVTVGNTVSKIKAYIRKRRSGVFSRLRYVLLFGDVDMITSETVGSNITDYYYSTQTDPTSTSPYVLPWLSIGRIPMRTSDEAMSVVDQIIDYENNPPCDPEYFDRMIFAAYFQGDGTATRAYMKTMEAIREHLLTLGFDVQRVYVSQTSNVQYYVDGTPVPQDVKDAIVDGNTATDMCISTTAEGQLLAGHRDHGGPSGWSHPSFNMDHLNAITSEYPTVFYSVNCWTGQFDRPAPTESFAERILKMKGGAPSIIAATRPSGTWRNNSMMKALFDAMWAGVLPTFPGSTASYSINHNRIGDVLNYSKTYLPIAHSGESSGIKDHFEIYHVIGDPTLEIWKTKPLIIIIQVKIVNNHLNINLSTCPKGSVITVWHADEMLKRIEASSTNIKIPLGDIRLSRMMLPLERDNLFVCFSAPGHRFRKVKVRL